MTFDVDELNKVESRIAKRVQMRFNIPRWHAVAAMRLAAEACPNAPPSDELMRVCVERARYEKR